MTKKKNLIVVLFSMVLMLFSFAFVFMQKDTIQASAEENTISATGNMIGASIRYDKNDTTQSGIRFSYVIDKSVSGINNLSDIKNAGILASFTSSLNGDLTSANATINTAFYTDGVASETSKINVGTYDATKREFTKDENGDDLLLQIYFYNIPLDTDKATEITCRGYLELNSGELVYSNALSRCIEYVATEAYKAKDYKDDAGFKAFLASCSTFYDVTFETNGGTAVEAQKVINGGVIEKATTAIDGYEFVEWTKADGTVVDETTIITENVTLYANFKKSVVDDTIIDAAEGSGLNIEGVKSATKVLVGDTVLDASAYTLEGEILTIDKAVLAQGKNTVKIYESDYVYTEYTKTVIDYTKALAFTSFDEEHILGAQYGTPVAGATSFVNNATVGDKTGSFVKVSVGSGIKSLGLKVASLYEKSVWEKYSGGTLKINYYMDVDAFTKNIGLLVTGVSGTDPVLAQKITGATVRTWNTAEIAVDDILANWEYFTSKAISAVEYPGTLMYFGYNGFAATGDVYFSDFTVEPFDTNAHCGFTSLDAAHIVGAQYGTPKADLTAFVNNVTVGGRTGSFVKVSVGSDIKTLALKVSPTISKTTLEKYSGNKLVINYYMDVKAYTNTLSTMITGGLETGSPTFANTITGAATRTWNTAEIAVDNILANWDTFTKFAISELTYSGTLMYFGYNGFTTEGDVYFDGFKIVPADYVDLSIPRKFTVLDTTHIIGAHYGKEKSALTSVVTDETVGGQMGTFVKITLDGRTEVEGGIQSLTLKVAPSIEKSLLAAYKGGKIVIKYYIDIEAYSSNTISTIAMSDSGNYKGTITGVTKKTWQTAEIAVDDLLENWDYFTKSVISAYTYSGVLMYFGWNSVNAMSGAVYFGGFDLVA